MVFPSLVMKVEPGLASSFVFYFMVLFSYILLRWKRITLALVIALIAIGVSLQSSYALMMAPTPNTPTRVPTQTVYPQYYGYYPAYYPYPTVPHHVFYGPVPYYYPQFTASPYRPYYLNDCPYCGARGMNGTYYYRNFTFGN